MKFASWRCLRHPRNEKHYYHKISRVPAGDSIDRQPVSRPGRTGKPEQHPKQLTMEHCWITGYTEHASSPIS
jgi:hypothetical protein